MKYLNWFYHRGANISNMDARLIYREDGRILSLLTLSTAEEEIKPNRVNEYLILSFLMTRQIWALQPGCSGISSSKIHTFTVQLPENCILFVIFSLRTVFPSLTKNVSLYKKAMTFSINVPAPKCLDYAVFLLDLQGILFTCNILAHQLYTHDCLVSESIKYPNKAWKCKN